MKDKKVVSEKRIVAHYPKTWEELQNLMKQDRAASEQRYRESLRIWKESKGKLGL